MIEFPNGTLLSIRLVNFQSYENIHVEFNKNINFIAGPNGSGKSSIANGIAILCNCPAKFLGKNANLNEFVKHGELDGYVEGEFMIDGSVVNIRRRLKSMSRNTKWFYNKIEKPESFIVHFYRKNNINIASLCTFLPQERVADFARASPEQLFLYFLQLLNLDGKFEEINLLEDRFSRDDFEKKKLQAKISDIQSKIDILKRDVDMANERDVKTRNIQIMTYKLTFLKYQVAVEEYKKLKGSIKEQNVEITSKKNRIIELDREIASIDEQLRGAENEKILQKIEVENKKVKFLNTDLKNHVIEKNNASIELRHAEKREKDREEKIDQLNEEIKRKKQEHDQIQPKEIEYQNFDMEISQSEKQLHSLNEQLIAMQREGQSISREISGYEEEINASKSEEGKRLNDLKHFHRDTYAAVSWLRKNAEEFTDRIIEPAFLSLKIKDSTYGAAIEYLLSYQLVSTFIVKNKDDYRKFISIVKDKNGLGINLCEEFADEENRVDCTKYGFDGYVIDFLEGPPETLALLKQLGAFHQIPISKNKISEEYVFKKTPFKRFIANNRIYEIKYNRYNENEYATTTMECRGTGLFNQKSIDLCALNRKIENLNGRRVENKKRLEKILAQKEEENKRHEHYLERKSDYFKANQKEILKRERKKHLLESIEQDKNELCKINLSENKIPEIKNRIKKFNEAICLAGKTLKEELGKKIFMLLYENVYSEIQKTNQLKERKQIFELNKYDLNNDIININKEMQHIRDIIERTKNEISAHKQILKNKMSDEEEKIAESFPADIGELEMNIVREKAGLQFININEEGIREYNKNLEILKSYEKRNENYTHEIQSKQEVINTERLEFLAKITDALKKLDKNFQRYFKLLKFEGQVKLEKADLMKNWRLTILVKFRPDEEFEVLRSSYQSGGEKSVSTIIFLLSLVEIINVPFRLVDEINQGMDAENERRIHKILGSITNTQLFIITPKIIDDLTFTENMKVHIIFPMANENIRNVFPQYKINKLI